MIRLRAAKLYDAPAIAAIYEPYVTGSIVSFETEAPDEDEMRRRMLAGGNAYPWIVAAHAEDRVAGYAYASAFRPRLAYRFSVETTVYVEAGHQGQGIGFRLYQALLDTLIAQGFTQAIGAIALPNPASVRLHERVGFTQAGVYRETGYKLGGWHDVGLWQRRLSSPANPPVEPMPITEAGLRLG